jgi:hypothetical protein
MRRMRDGLSADVSRSQRSHAMPAVRIHLSQVQASEVHRQGCQRAPMRWPGNASFRSDRVCYAIHSSNPSAPTRSIAGSRCKQSAYRRHKKPGIRRRRPSRNGARHTAADIPGACCPIVERLSYRTTGASGQASTSSERLAHGRGHFLPAANSGHPLDLGRRSGNRANSCQLTHHHGRACSGHLNSSNGAVLIELAGMSLEALAMRPRVLSLLALFGINS